jgi:hypothetical protein
MRNDGLDICLLRCHHVSALGLRVHYFELRDYQRLNRVDEQSTKNGCLASSLTVTICPIERQFKFTE